MTETALDIPLELRTVLDRHADRLDAELVERAFRFSAQAHRGQ